ncbi:MAG: PH domain-containing protein [Microbacterium sp.]|uniref:PH domain-containing protein n=1 Tax=Microbacterium sp. TaxID=51671 RepID=UPI0039E2DB16
MSAPDPGSVRSSLSDGRWHRLHPLTPLLRGGLALVVVIGIVVANLRERLVSLVLPLFDPKLRAPAGTFEARPGDPIDWVIANNLYLLAALTVLGVLILLVVAFTLSWRFHTFRITGELVEVRQGILFRSHRRAPLDRVQGVGLARPLLARLIGLAKLEVVGAAGNVRLEYLRTVDAETVRADILRLASGRRLAEQEHAGGPAGLVDTVARGVTGILEGPEPIVATSESMVDIPVPRLIGAHLLHNTTVVIVLAVIALVGFGIADRPIVLVVLAPAVIGMIAYEGRRLVRALQYAIAPTADGVRITFGLFTTVTETIPPGRIHAVEIGQPVLWRPAGWWDVRINRLSGRRSAEAGKDQLTTVLPVGTRADVERVLALVLPQIDPTARQLAAAAAAGQAPGFETTPGRAWFLHPLSWRRAGVLATRDALLLRRGLIRRRVVLVPLARMQGISVTQGPIARAVRVARLRAHTVRGPVDTSLAAVDRDVAARVWDDAERAAVAEAEADRSHRWADPVAGGAATEEDG